MSEKDDHDQSASEPNDPPDQLHPAPSWEAELDVYPLRPPSEDPGWAVKTVWAWAVFAVASILFIVALTILGAIYD